jgi:O-antigen ligase
MSRRLSVTQFAWIVFVSSSLYLLVGTAVELVLGTFAPLDDAYRFAGTLHPNHQAMNCAALGLASLHLFTADARFKRLFLCVGTVAFGFLLLTRSRTAAGAFFVAVVLYAVAAGFRRLHVAWSVGLVCGTATVAITLVLLTAPDALLLGRSDSDPETFTGRAVLWEKLGDYAADAPLAGYGYNAFWTPEHIEDVSRVQYWTVFEGHSTYMDVLLGTGACGLFLYLATLVLAVVASLARAFSSRDPEHALVAAVLALSACEGLLESALLTTSTLAFLLMWALACTSQRADPGRTVRVRRFVVADLEWVHG